MNKMTHGALAGVAAGLLGTPCTLVAVVAAWMFRAKVVPLETLALHLDIVGMLLAGSLAGAWWGRSCRRLPAWLDHVLAVLLTGMACALLVLSWPGPAQHHASLFASGGAAVALGVGAGALFAWRSASGAVVLVAALVLLFGLDIKVAGSLALMIVLPTLLVAQPVQRLRSDWRSLVVPVTGAALGTGLLALLPSDILMAVLAVSIQLIAMGSLLPARRVESA